MSIPIQKLSDDVLREPLVQETFIIRKNLLMASCITVFLTVYNIKIQELPWVKLSVENIDDSQNILLGALFIAVLYFLTRFVVSALSDLGRWVHTKSLIAFHNYDAVSNDFWNRHKEIEMCLTKRRNGEPISNPVVLPETLKSAVNWFNEASKRARVVRRSNSALSFLQWIKLIVIDLLIPCSMGVFSLYLTHKAFLPFIMVLFKS